MGWDNVLWGSDYPHFEGTFGHTQKTLHELFDAVHAALLGHADLLAEPDSSDAFAADPFREGYVSMIQALRETVEVAGEVEEDYAVKDGTVVAMQAADGGADDGQPRRHPFERGKPKPFTPRRHREHMRSVELVAHSRTIHRAHQLYGVGNPMLRRDPF